ncbi:CRISPR-associated endonuclease Cas2 [Desulfothermobacter acidiphilus]|uniref:CRISPR-associated endonuclease Cas2 n=1 Tax=Desulfothermobacter acidiphilus TaxID=1938353 RepID=UPI003F8B3DD8
MKTLVVYDIPDDRIRVKVFETCKDYGLIHIQYSAFLGPLNQNRRQELYQRLRRILGKKEGKIIICPICDKDLALMLEIAMPEEAACQVKEASKKGPVIY